MKIKLTPKESKIDLLMTYINLVFKLLFFFYLVLLILENFEKKFVTLFFDYNYLLIPLLLLGLVIVIIGRRSQKSFLEKDRQKVLVKSFVIGISVIILSFWQLYDNGAFGFVVSVFYGFFAVLIYILLVYESSTK